MMTDVLSLTQELIAKPSITPDDQGCQRLIANRLNACGFAVENLPFEAVHNLWAQFGDKGPLIVFAGHTDVVPPGPLTDWTHPPFTPTIVDGTLYGRGAADMKSGLAAMICATERFLAATPQPNLRIAFLITSDEEGPAQHGTKRVVEWLSSHAIPIDYCIVGEASCEHVLGDTIKNGRRGSLCGSLTLHGTQGHIAYPALADNPIHKAAPFLQALCATQWDQGNDYFPATCLQISNIHAGTGADNVIPGRLDIEFNVRYSPETTAEVLQHKITSLLDNHQLKYDISWRLSGEPFLTKTGDLSETLQQAIEEITGITPKLSTSGGTSDGRFIATLGCQVLEFGPPNGSIHKVDEHIKTTDLEQLTRIYQTLLERLNRLNG